MGVESVRELLKSFVFNTIIVFLVVGTLYGGYAITREIISDPVYEDRVVASGIIDDKYDSSYSCGSKGRYTCFTRYLVVGGKQVVVSDDLYLKKRKGEHITLTMNTLVDRGYVMNGWGFLSAIVFAVVAVVSAVMFFMWVFDDEAAERRKISGKGFWESFDD